jgi:hypothetical protein
MALPGSRACGVAGGSLAAALALGGARRGVCGSRTSSATRAAVGRASPRSRDKAAAVDDGKPKDPRARARRERGSSYSLQRSLASARRACLVGCARRALTECTRARFLRPPHALQRAALDKVLAEIDSTFGKGSIMRLGDAASAKARSAARTRARGVHAQRANGLRGGLFAHIVAPYAPPHARIAAQVETFSTGALTLDLALGGGLPRGRIIEARVTHTHRTHARTHTRMHAAALPHTHARPTLTPRARPALRCAALRAHCRSTARKAAARRRWRCTRWLRCSARAAPWRSSTRSTRSTRRTPRRWGWTRAR